MSDSTSKDLIIKEISNSPLVKKEYKNMDIDELSNRVKNEIQKMLDS
mgnify:CR=1 FL=1